VPYAEVHVGRALCGQSGSVLKEDLSRHTCGHQRDAIPSKPRSLRHETKLCSSLPQEKDVHGSTLMSVTRQAPVHVSRAATDCHSWG
jgi:hypothetical protein